MRVIFYIDDYDDKYEMRGSHILYIIPIPYMAYILDVFSFQLIDMYPEMIIC